MVVTELTKEDANTTLSSGTLRKKDLIPTFLAFLMSVADRVGLDKDVLKRKIAIFNVQSAIIQEHKEQIEIDAAEEYLHYLLNEDIWSILDEIAPPNCYFGAHEGDGALFGFWEYPPEPA